jgi:hypothetical protein
MLSKKSFAGIYENFLKLLMRSMRGDVWDHIASQKNDHGLSYRNCEASQRRSSPKITICEIFGVVRFSTFSTASVKVGRTHSEQMSSGLPLRADIVRCSWHRREERHLPGFPQPSATVCLFHCFIALTRGTRSRRNSVLLVNRLGLENVASA